MDSLLGFLALVCIIWCVAGMFIPGKVAPFFNGSRRKKIFVSFFIIMLIIGAIGHEVSPTPSSNPAQQQQEKTYGIGDTFNAKNFEITVLDKKTAKSVADSSGAWKTTANGKFVILTIKYKNISNANKKLDNSAFQLKLNDKTYSPTTLVSSSNDNIFLESINPGIEKTGKVYFDVPVDVADSNDFVLQLSKSFASDNSTGKISLHQ
ncbi:DUF4352 domain-containing protein [Megasphaera elsdenii]|uniref:DUF4352 domain-containing protein n=1 Tax=Megasphaera elsdenii TaxID=907 RepID=UPI00242A3378|nr:DUF4352 domain-containing protein [Megasphaera elsdenii]